MVSFHYHHVATWVVIILHQVITNTITIIVSTCQVPNVDRVVVEQEGVEEGWAEPRFRSRCTELRLLNDIYTSFLEEVLTHIKTIECSMIAMIGICKTHLTPWGRTSHQKHLKTGQRTMETMIPLTHQVGGPPGDLKKSYQSGNPNGQKTSLADPREGHQGQRGCRAVFCCQPQLSSGRCGRFQREGCYSGANAVPVVDMQQNILPFDLDRVLCSRMALPHQHPYPKNPQVWTDVLSGTNLWVPPSQGGSSSTGRRNRLQQLLTCHPLCTVTHCAGVMSCSFPEFLRTISHSRRQKEKEWETTNEKKPGIRTEPCFIESNDDICPNISIPPASPISKYIFLFHPKYPNIYSFSSQISKYIFNCL